MNDVAINLRVTSIRSRGHRGGAIFSGVTAEDAPYVVVCDYALIPDLTVLGKGQTWRIEGTSQSRSYEINGYRKTEQQVLARAVELLAPSGANLIDWIANSDECVGIGPVKAARLFKRFGEALIVHIEQRNFAELQQCLSKGEAESLCAAFEKHRVTHTLLWLDRAGIPRRMGRKLLDYFGETAQARVEGNPYVLISFSASWDQVDRLATTSFGVCQDDERRLSAAVEHVLYDAYKDGHTCLPRRAACARLVNLLGTRQLANRALDEVRSESVRVLEDGSYQAEGGAVIESFLASRIRQIVDCEMEEGQQSLWTSTVVEARAIDAAIAKFERALSWPLGEEQRRAVHTCINSNLSLILGGAGTGKTTVLKCLYDVMEATRDGVVIYQMALAGRAAQRMTEATGRPSMTIAAFLARVQAADLSSDSVVVVDEMSMVDVILAYRLLRHLPIGVKVVLVGDPSQLAPIGPGLVLHALAGQKSVPQVVLSQVRRQSSTSGIPKVAEAVRLHRVPEFAEYAGNGSGVSFVRCAPSQLETAVIRIYEELGGQGADFTVQVLAITVNNLGSANALNQALHSKFRSDAVQVQYFHPQFGVVGATTPEKLPIKVGDLVMFGKSDDELQLRNGSLGKVVEALPVVDEDSDVCVCDFEGTEVRLKARHLDDLKHSYAITIHKSQGSQFNRVIIPVRESRLLDQSLIYTGITRSVDQVVLVGDLDATIAAIKAPAKAARRHVNLPALLNLKMAEEATDPCEISSGRRASTGVAQCNNLVAGPL